MVHDRGFGNGFHCVTSEKINVASFMRPARGYFTVALIV